uniref:non-specific serine/threonine protein kinase n=1 Tax=Eutreptiella gymnastica TaxID=73025 RepID=A0A7S1NFQ4_9EUGL|mmetsp:Transcript_29001/g.52075  ORF Transcript_29001/g.52075 Transcript_29001/m.52075 type:complete len:335 (+) Transcript_29001:61-1065(+)
MPLSITNTDLQYEDQDLGFGSLSRVVLARHNHNGTYYAIKIMSKNQVISNKAVDLVMQEKEILGRLEHPNVVSIISTFQTDIELYYVLEYCNGGELLYHIEVQKGLDPLTTKWVTAELVNAVTYLHLQGVAHRDLKPQNVVFIHTEHGPHLKLIDFATAAVSTEQPRPLGKIVRTADDELEDLDDAADERMRSRWHAREAQGKRFIGTCQYCSPEMIIDCTATYSSDLWALGTVVYHMVAGTGAFDDEDSFAVLKRILSWKFTYPEGFDAGARTLCDALIVLCPTARLGVGPTGCAGDQLKAHPYFTGVDWDALPTQQLDVHLSEWEPAATQKL